MDVAGQLRCTSLIQSSDIRLKEDITPIDNALDTVMNLQGISFKWREEEYSDTPQEGRETGLIAQEVEEVLPEVVSTDSEGYKSVEYGNIVSVLIEAIKSQQSQIDELKARIEALER